jgi:tape measure domain-containing protein
MEGGDLLMSTAIEEKVLAMKFDGAQFLTGIDKSLTALDKLNKGLKLQEATKGLDGIGASASRQVAGLKNIEAGISTIAGKFKTLGVVGVAAISNITNQAIFAGQTLVKSLTLDPLMDGFREYETNLNSVQTILANTGSAFANVSKEAHLDAVNKSLDELNHYSDQTIYNFSEMAKNIGTFTAAGVGLKESTAAIKGIANLAALSGSNSQQASGAMYQLSQAISAGRVSLEDWNSVVNAGMGGTVFQRALATTAEKMGTLKKGAVDLVGPMKNVSIGGKSFRESITAKPGQESWLTSKVLTQTLAQFTGDLKDADLAAQGFNKSEIKAIQAQAKTAKEAATQVKTFTQLMGTIKESVGSGWASTWEIIFGDFTEAKGLFTGVSKTIGKIVQDSANARNKFLTDWKNAGGRDSLISALGNSFNALLSVIKPIKEAFRQIFPAMTGKQLADLTKRLAEFTAKLKIGGDTADKLKRTFAGVFAVFGIAWDIIKGVAGVLGRLFGVVTSGSGGFLKLTANVGDFLVNLRQSLKDGNTLTNFFKKLGDILLKPIELIKKFASAVKDAFTGVDFSKAGKGISGFFTGLWAKVAPIVDKLKTFFSGLKDMIGGALEGVSWGDFLKTLNTGAVLGIAGYIGILIKKVKDQFLGGGGGDNGPGFLDKLTEPFEQLTDTLKSMQNSIRAATIIEIAVAVGILTLSVKALAKIDADGLTRALTALTIMFTQLGAALFAFEKYLGEKDIAKMIGLGIAMGVLAIAVRILVGSVKSLAELSWNDLAKGLTGLVVILGALVGTMKLMPDDKKMISSAVGLVILAAGIKLLVSAVTDLAGMSWEELSKGLVGVAATLLAVGLFTKFAKVDKDGAKSGLGLLLMASGIKVMASALSQLGGMSWGELAQGLAAMAGALFLMASVLKGLPPDAVLSAASFLIVAIALQQVGKAMATFAEMSWGEIGKSLVAMAGAMLILATSLSAIPPTALLGAASLLIVSYALGPIGEAMQKFGAMGWGEILKATVLLAATLSILGIAMTLMIAALPGAVALLVVAAALAVLAPVLQTLGAMSLADVGTALLALGGAFVVLGVAGLLMIPVVPVLVALGIAVGLLGVGLLAAGVGLLAFATALTVLGTLGKAASDNVVNMVKALMGLIPELMKQIGLGIVAFAQVIAQSGPAITNAITTVLESLINAIARLTPKIVNTLLSLLTMLLNALANYVPKMVDAGLRLITGILNGIARNVGKMAAAATNVVTKFMAALATNIPKLADSGAKMVIKLVNGIADAIRSNAKAMGEAGGNLATAIIEGMARGLAGGVGKVVDAAKNVARSALNSAKNFLGIHSPSKEFEKVGNFVNDGFRKGLDGNKDQVYKAFDDLKKMLKDLNKESSKDVDTLEAKLKKLKQKPRTNAKEITKTKAALAQARKEEKASDLAYKTLTKNLNDEKTALGKLAVQYDAVTAKLDTAKKTLEDAQKTRDDYNKSIADQYGNALDPSGDTTAADYITNLQKQVEDTKKFTNEIQQLRAMGINDETYKDLLSAGTSALPFIEDLLKGGSDSVKQINDLNSQLDSVSASLGKTASSQLYQAAVDSAAGLVKGLEAQQANIEKQMDKIADAMVKSIKKKLGIKSPSRVFAEVGGYSGEGLANGLLDSSALVNKAAKTVGDKAVITLKKTLSDTDKMTLSGVDMTPVIRPKLDLTDIQNGAGKIGTLLPSAKLNVSAAYSNAAAADAAVRAGQGTSQEYATATAGTTLNYTQINNSPKAISAVETYRNTKNQLSTVKGALDANARKG